MDHNSKQTTWVRPASAGGGGQAAPPPQPSSCSSSPQVSRVCFTCSILAFRLFSPCNLPGQQPLGKAWCNLALMVVNHHAIMHLKLPCYSCVWVHHWEQRVCRHCSMQAVEDEQHFLFDCPFYSIISGQHFSLFGPNYHQRDLRLFFEQNSHQLGFVAHHIFQYLSDWPLTIMVFSWECVIMSESCFKQVGWRCN